VRVCPTGIDIRNGLQLECVNCAQCIDACDSIMEKVRRPKGLIRYDTERHLLGGKRKILRPRLVVYATLLILYSIIFTYILATRINFDFDILREPGAAVFVRLPNGSISNQFKAKVSNKSNENTSFQISAEIEGLRPEEYQVVIALPNITVDAGQMIDSIPVFVTLPQDKLSGGKRKMKFVLRSANGAVKNKEVNILGPTE